jgi:glycosyltransferase involved in cell wall biosynthesis
VRIAHSHNDTSSLASSLARTVYLESMRRLIAANCTQGLAASMPAAGALFGPKWQNDTRFQVLYCGIDPEPCSGQFNLAAVRAEFGFSSQDVVFGHVGRFDPQKNHQFYLETAAEIRKLEPRAKFLLVGDGPLRPEIEARARALGLQGCTVFAGIRSDVPRLMTSGMDLFLFPSLHEGLPIVLLEAQAAGLTSLVSEGISREVVIHPALVRHLPLPIGARDWARIACDAVKEPRFGLRKALDLFTSSPFGVDRCVQLLCDVYRGQIPIALPEHQERGITIA